MTNDEINRAIAETLGWRLDPDWRPPNMPWLDGNGNRRIQQPSWATDLNAAVGLLEEYGAWSVSKVTHESETMYPIYLATEPVSTLGKTPARAICLAFLKSKGVEM